MRATRMAVVNRASSTHGITITRYRLLGAADLTAPAGGVIRNELARAKVEPGTSFGMGGPGSCVEL